MTPLKQAEPTPECLVQTWNAENVRLSRALDELNAAKIALEKAAVALGNKIVPDDAALGERILFWVGGKLLEVARTSHNPNHYRIAWRGKTEPKTCSDEPQISLTGKRLIVLTEKGHQHILNFPVLIGQQPMAVKLANLWYKPADSVEAFHFNALSGTAIQKS